MVVRVLFPCKNPSYPNILITTDLFFATYDELVILTNAWKLNGSLSYIVVHILVELASNSARYTGGKMAINHHPDTCLISKSGTY